MIFLCIFLMNWQLVYKLYFIPISYVYTNSKIQNHSLGFWPESLRNIEQLPIQPELQALAMLLSFVMIQNNYLTFVWVECI